MSTPEYAFGGGVRKECRICQKAFSKGEHLRRHERSHTGARPFVCKACKRSFARQDSLARHEKLHTRKDSTKHASAPLTPISEPSIHGTPGTDVSEAHAAVAANLAIPDQLWAEPQSVESAGLQSVPPAADLDFELIWPDSEDLFQTIMSSDTAHQWQMPLGTLPFPPVLPQMNNLSSRSPGSFDDRASSIGVIPSGGSHQAVHDVTRMVSNLSSSVSAAVEAVSITSVFLDECLHMFFVRFIPTFPVLHRATFIFRECTHPLLLNAMAIGSLYLGPKDAVAKGEALWRLAHTAVATSWQTLITHRGPYDACKGVQLVITALLSQVYGALSKNRAIRTTSQTFHALGFFWARHCGMFDTEPYSMNHLPSFDASEAEKEHQWRTWVAREIQQRALLANYVLDGLIAQMSGETTSARHAANQLGPPSSEAAFEASTTDEWLSHMRSEKADKPSFRSIFRSLFAPTGVPYPLEYTSSAFSLRVVLEGLQSLIADCDESDIPAVGVPTRSEIRRALAQVHEIITSKVQLPETDRLETLLRWHAICLDAATDSSLLCRYVCSRYNVDQHVFGGGKGIKPELDLIRWANTEDARRALLHAAAIQDIVEQLPRGRAHVIHMPSSLFAAATVYSVFTLAGSITVSLPRTVDWKDVLYTETDSWLALGEIPGSAIGSDTRRYIRGDSSSFTKSLGASRNLLYELNSMQKLFRCLFSQWGVAHDMENVVDQWIALCH